MLIGEKDPLSSTDSCTRIFRELGCEALHWDNKQRLLLFGNRSWWRLSRIERLAYDALASHRFVNACRNFRPDLIFTQKGENIHARAIRQALDETGGRLVIWYGDNPFCADVTTMEVLKNLRRCDIFYSYGKFMIDALRSAGCRRVEYLPFAFDPVTHPPDIVLEDAELPRYEADLCFVGTWDPQRERQLAILADMNLAIWGQFWNERTPPSSPLARCVRGGTVWGREMVKCFKGAKLVLNFLRDFNYTSHNFRTMEATGIGGGALLTKRTVEQAEVLFTEKQHLFCYNSLKDVREQIPDLLQNGGRLWETSQAARKHVHEHHLLKHRIEQILSDVGAL